MADDSAMADDLITFVIDGADARNGYVSASVFASKFQAFLATIYALERTFAGTSLAPAAASATRCPRTASRSCEIVSPAKGRVP